MNEKTVDKSDLEMEHLDVLDSCVIRIKHRQTFA